MSTTSNGYDRVRAHTFAIVNERLDRRAGRRLERAASDSEFAERRAIHIDREWELDRVILLPFAALGGAALALGLRRDRRWKYPLAMQLGFMLAHAVIGWCPPAVVLRRLGFRSRQEIEAERGALAMVRAVSTST